MVIKGGARGGPVALAQHLERTDTNERVTVRELCGVTAKDLRGALREMDGMAAAAESRRTLYHANIDTRPGEELTEAQKAIAVERLGAKLGLTGQARVVVEHVKEGREHMHVVFLRIDLTSMTAIPYSHNYRKHEDVARELEREFGHERVQGAHVERNGQPRPARTPSHSEMQQAARSGIAPQEAKARVTELWNRSDTGTAFAAALENDGWILARGDKRDFVILDRAGETHSLGRRIEGAKAAQVRDRMADIDPASLPSVQEAKALHAERTLHRGNEKDHGPVPQPQHSTATPVEAAPSKPEVVEPPLTPPPHPLEVTSAPQPPRQAQPEPQEEPPPDKPAEIERPAPAMFQQLYTAAIEITQRVWGKARKLFDRRQSEQPKPARKARAKIKPEHVREVTRPPDPQPQAEPRQPEQTAREEMDEALRLRIEREQKTRPRMTAEQLRAQIDRQRSRNRNRDGPEL